MVAKEAGILNVPVAPGRYASIFVMLHDTDGTMISYHLGTHPIPYHRGHNSFTAPILLKCILEDYGDGG